MKRPYSPPVFLAQVVIVLVLLLLGNGRGQLIGCPECFPDVPSNPTAAPTIRPTSASIGPPGSSAVNGTNGTVTPTVAPSIVLTNGTEGETGLGSNSTNSTGGTDGSGVPTVAPSNTTNGTDAMTATPTVAPSNATNSTGETSGSEVPTGMPGNATNGTDGMTTTPTVAPSNVTNSTGGTSGSEVPTGMPTVAPGNATTNGTALGSAGGLEAESASKTSFRAFHISLIVSGVVFVVGVGMLVWEKKRHNKAKREYLENRRDESVSLLRGNEIDYNII